MALQMASIASGSNGNCYYIGNDTEAVLVDVGISCKEIEKRMQRMGLSMGKVKAIFVSHEHADHICGLAVTAKRYGTPVFITPPTLRNARTFVPKAQINSFAAHEPVTIGGLHITAFGKQHDAADPYSFIVTGNGVTIGVLTDIGLPCEQVRHYFRQCHAAFLESNYDEDLLMKGSYPWVLKMRIHGDQGHLSNRQALALFKEFQSPQLSRLVLAHLSKNNNRPQLVQALFDQHAGGVNITVASRYEESAVFTVQAADRVVGQTVTYLPVAPPKPQLSFSFE